MTTDDLFHMVMNGLGPFPFSDTPDVPKPVDPLRMIEPMPIVSVEGKPAGRCYCPNPARFDFHNIPFCGACVRRYCR